METKNDLKYLSAEILPAVLVHPGSTLGEELKARGIRQKDFAAKIGMQPSHLSALIHGTKNITTEIALKIESGLDGISAAFWLRLQEQYNLDRQRSQRGFRTRHLVAGYQAEPNPVPVLADSGIPTQVIITLPTPDLDLLVRLSGRFGWQIEEI